MIETHPFGEFIPAGARYLLLGSFPGRHSTTSGEVDDPDDWFYGSKRNQFWPILETVYGMTLNTKQSRQDLLSALGIAVADIIYQCERTRNSNLDASLGSITYNVKPLERLFTKNKIERVYFTSRFVEVRFKKLFDDAVLGKAALHLLPSPSPRFTKLSKWEKVEKYRELLPQTRGPRS